MTYVLPDAVTNRLTLKFWLAHIPNMFLSCIDSHVHQLLLRTVYTCSFCLSCTPSTLVYLGVRKECSSGNNESDQA